MRQFLRVFVGWFTHISHVSNKQINICSWAQAIRFSSIFIKHHWSNKIIKMKLQSSITISLLVHEKCRAVSLT